MRSGPDAGGCGPANPTAEATVYFDGSCPLCRAEIDHYRRSAGAERVAFVDVAGEGAAERLGPGLTRDAALRRFHLRDRDGQLLSGATAFAHLWTVLPRWRWLGRLIALRLRDGRPVLRTAELFYRLSLPLRPRLARLLTRLRLL